MTRPGHGRLAAGLLLAAVATTAGANGPDAAALHKAQAHWLSATGQADAARIYLRQHDIRHGALAGELAAGAGLVTTTRQAVAGPGHDRSADSAWLALATNRLRLHDADATAQALQAMSTPLPPEQAGRRAGLLARARLHRNQPDDAALPLAWERRRRALAPIDRYHLGIARLRAGEHERGLAELERLAGYAGDDPTRKALADQANLALGYWYLDHQRGGQARRAFLRVRLDRPLTRKAMLGLGWAQISGGGLTQALLTEETDDCSGHDPDLWSDSDPLHRAPRPTCRLRDVDDDRRLLDARDLADTKASQYRRAAAAWRAAAEDVAPGDPVAAEALASLPFALARAGDGRAAAQAFRTAIEHLEEVLATPQVIAADAPYHPLVRLSQDLQRTRQQLAASAASLDALLARAADPPDAAAALRAALATITNGQTPAASQNGRLLVALQPLQSKPNLRVDTQRLRTLAERIEPIDGRLETLRDSLQRGRRAESAARSEALRATLTAYLRQSRRGLATLRD